MYTQYSPVLRYQSGVYGGNYSWTCFPDHYCKKTDTYSEEIKLFFFFFHVQLSDVLFINVKATEMHLLIF